MLKEFVTLVDLYVDCGEHVGLGHLMRSTALAENLGLTVNKVIKIEKNSAPELKVFEKKDCENLANI